MNNFGNLDKMDKFLKRHEILKLSQEETSNNLNSPIPIKEIEIV